MTSCLNRVALAAAVCLALQAGSQPPMGTVAAAVARIQANDPDGAAAILDGVLAKDPANPRALYQRAIVAAMKKDGDGVFEWLRRAKATRKFDMTQATVSAALAPYRSDSRFAGVLPSRADFDHPFVEDVKILREWDGEAANDQFGWIARNIGDVDGDRIPDVVTSAPTAGAGQSAGRIYVYSTKSGKKLWSADGAEGDQLGTGIEGAGDTNKDGLPDVIAAAPGGGYAKIYSGRDGRVLLTLNAEQKSDQFGRHADGAGDVNGDGYADLIVGAPGNNAAGEGAGRAYVYSGKDGRVLLTLSGERAGDGFGSAVAGYSREGRTFLLVGAPHAGATHTGRTYVYDALTSKPTFVIESDDTGNALGGMFLSIPGDMDGDRIPDVYASDWSNRANGLSTGRVYVHSGADGHRLFTFTGETAGEGFGTSPSVAGDVDGDGRADLIVGAWQYSGAAIGAGRAYLYSGKDGRLVRTYTCRTPGDTFGFDAVSLGDIDEDGTIDFLITSAWSGVSGFHSGRIFVISSGVPRRAHP